MGFRAFLESKEFDYTNLARKEWRKLLNDANKEFGISFDDENDEAIATREIIIEQDFWEGTKCKFTCEMRKAGGDWQCSVVYFRCQLTKGYANIPIDGLFIFIPSKDEGNSHLEKTEKGFIAPDSNGPKAKQPKPNEKLCWTSLNKYLDKLVKEEIDKVKKNRCEL